MKQTYIIHENHPKLLLLFAGWAADETPFRQYRPQGMDYIVCYDYRTLDFDASVFERYRQVNVVAWSMGVWAASRILGGIPRANVFSIAFNGSTRPIGDLEGIPSGIYQATLDRLTPESLQKFMRRMCKDSHAYKAFMQMTPRRDFDEIKEELARIREQCLGQETEAADDEARSYAYDYAFVGLNDLILPPGNLLRNHTNREESIVITTGSAHYDEAMFRFLLQDVWAMSAEDFMRHLPAIRSGKCNGGLCR